MARAAGESRHEPRSGRCRLHARGARRSIAAHYDLGNEFFELFLDPPVLLRALFTHDAIEPGKTPRAPSWIGSVASSDSPAATICRRRLRMGRARDPRRA